MLRGDVLERMAWVCPECGHGNLDQWENCAKCGLKKSFLNFKKASI